MLFRSGSLMRVELYNTHVQPIVCQKSERNIWSGYSGISVLTDSSYFTSKALQARCLTLSWGIMNRQLEDTAHTCISTFTFSFKAIATALRTPHNMSQIREPYRQRCLVNLDTPEGPYRGWIDVHRSTFERRSK